MQITEQQALALAPDAQVATAGKKLGAAKFWANLGLGERALWGECQGSGSKPYQVRISHPDHSAECSCPSLKFPCKHAIGLLVLAALQPAQFHANPEPDWVSDWLGRRAQKAQLKQQRAEASAAKPVDLKAQARRQNQRTSRIEDGLAGLKLWLEDLMRRGLAQVAGDGPDIWVQQAARLIDAQLPGVAGRLRALAERIGQDEQWPAEVLTGLGQIALLIQAWQQRANLSPALVDELELQLGKVWKEDEILARAQVQQDHWQVVGQITEDLERIRIRRSWLVGEQSGRRALLLHTAIGAAFPLSVVPGSRFSGRLSFWPGVQPLRALIIEGSQSALPPLTELAQAESLTEFLERRSQILAENPWQSRMPVLLRDIRAVQQANAFWLVDAQGQALPASRRLPASLWQWLLITAGRPHLLIGESDAGAVQPLAVLMDGHYLSLEIAC